MNATLYLTDSADKCPLCKLDAYNQNWSLWNLISGVGGNHVISNFNIIFMSNAAITISSQD